jgi:hypothetical protein
VTNWVHHLSRSRRGRSQELAHNRSPAFTADHAAMVHGSAGDGTAVRVKSPALLSRAGLPSRYRLPKGFPARSVYPLPATRDENVWPTSTRPCGRAELVADPCRCHNQTLRSSPTPLVTDTCDVGCYVEEQ